MFAMRLASGVSRARQLGGRQMDSLAAIFLVICGFIEYGSAIMCYECNSATNTYCSAAVLPESLKKNCSVHDRGITQTLCRKIVQHVDHAVNGKYPEPRVIRSCGWDETKYKGMCYHRSGYGGRQEVCSCLNDFCNTGHSLTASGLLTATLISYCVILLCQ